MTIEFKLSYSEKEKLNISSLMEEIYYDELSKLDPINEGEINISSLYIYDLGDKLEAKVIVRNALSQSISLDKAPLIIIDGKNEVVLEEVVDLNDLGVIPSNHARPYSILFNKGNLKKEVVNFEQCKVIFNNNVKTLETKKIENVIIDEEIPMMESHQIKEYVSKLSPIKIGDVNVIGYRLYLDEAGKKNFIVIIANANRIDVTLQNFTVGFKNSLGIIVAQQPVRDEFVVEPFTAKAVKILLEEGNISSQDYHMDHIELFIKPSV
ncbi:MAG: SLAP domain-containing protein [Clostridiaceae bacterium]